MNKINVLRILLSNLPEKSKDIRVNICKTSRIFIKGLIFKINNENFRMIKGSTIVNRIKFGDCFNQTIKEGALPLSLIHLTFGICFNQPINERVLPPNLTHLTFDVVFNQPIKEGVLPENLAHLTFGTCFNQPIKEGVLPENLAHLTFGTRFNQPIKKGILPPNILLKLGNNYTHKDTLPKNIRIEYY